MYTVSSIRECILLGALNGQLDAKHVLSYLYMLNYGTFSGAHVHKLKRILATVYVRKT